MPRHQFRSRAAEVAVALLVASAGCAHYRTGGGSPAVVTEYRPDGCPGLAMVPAAAVYTLHREADGKAVVTRYLPAGTPLGFDRDGYGRPRAVAGTGRWPLADGPHRWQVTPEDRRRERERERDEAIAAAYRKVDQSVQVVGQILYPPLLVVSFPFWALCGGGTGPGAIPWR